MRVVRSQSCHSHAEANGCEAYPRAPHPHAPHYPPHHVSTVLRAWRDWRPQHLNKRCTHLLAGNNGDLCSNTKILAACVRGIWVLNVDYLDKCHEQNEFIEEDEHQLTIGQQNGSSQTAVDTK